MDQVNLTLEIWQYYQGNKMDQVNLTLEIWQQRWRRTNMKTLRTKVLILHIRKTNCKHRNVEYYGERVVMTAVSTVKQQTSWSTQFLCWAMVG
ncbi:hypothetical protein QE152_g3640 [Popillia japonica]|uniref:Uncharacterized protein n=1 Tax=Popillia japonica TaxID=7064 RepID=A0AAW1N624_POPJA